MTYLQAHETEFFTTEGLVVIGYLLTLVTSLRKRSVTGAIFGVIGALAVVAAFVYVMIWAT